MHVCGLFEEPACWSMGQGFEQEVGLERRFGLQEGDGTHAPLPILSNKGLCGHCCQGLLCLAVVATGAG